MTAGTMALGWYYSKWGAPPGQQTGPLAWEQLYSLAQAGTLTSGDLVWHQTLPGWLPAAQIPGLFRSAGAATALSPQQLCYAAVPPTRRAKSHRKLRIALAVGIPVLALLVVLSIVVLPRFFAGKTSTQISSSGGQVVLDDFQMTFGEGAVDGSVDVTVTDVTSQQEMAGMQSQLYMVEVDQLCDKPVTVSLTLPENADTENLMLGFGTEMVSADGTTATTAYRYVEATVVNGALEAQIVPADYTGGIGFYRMKAPAVPSSVTVGTTAGSTRPGNITFVCGIFATEVYYQSGGHFRLLYPTGPNDNINVKSNAYKLLDDLESAYNAFIEAGFNYDNRTTWPVDVSIVPMDVEGAYVENGLANTATGRSSEHGWLELNVRSFAAGYNREILKGIIGHEWFHFVQANYCASGVTSAWLADATATWYEGRVTNTVPGIIQQYIERLFDGVIPATNTDTAADGYARAPVIGYLIDKFGMKSILETYKSIDTGTDPRAALIAATADPTAWAADCYEYVVSGKAIDQDPYKFYENICNKDPAVKPFSSIVDLRTPTADEIAKAVADQTPLKVGQLQITIPPVGARLIAIRADSSLAKVLVDGTSLVIRVGGAPVDYRLFSINGKTNSISKAGVDGVVVGGLKKAMQDNTTFLLLVTSMSDSTKIVAGLTAELQMNAPDINGNWTGQYKIHFTMPSPNKDYYESTEVTFRLSPEGTGTVGVHSEGAGPRIFEADATYRGGVVQFELFGIFYTGQFTGDNVLTLSGKSSEGTNTFELTRKQ